MKKTITLSAAFIAIIAGAVFLGHRNQSQPAKAEPQKVTVGILQTMSHPALDQINDGVIKGLRQGGYKVGKNLIIKQENAEADQSNLKSMSERLLTDHTKLTVGIATPAAMSLASAADGKSPVVLAGITDPAGSKLVKTEAKPGANITGTSGEAPLDKQLDVLTTIVQHPKQIGVIYSPSDHGGAFNAKKFAQIAGNKGYKTKLYTIANTGDVQQVAAQMSSECDAIYAPQDNLVASAMKTLVGTATEAKVPVIPAADTMVKDGGIASYAISQVELGRAAGIMAAKILNGKDPADYPVKHVDNGVIVINTTTAKKLGITLPEKLVTAANKDGVVFK